jgi:predicted phosphoribosyltransferase
VEAMKFRDRTDAGSQLAVLLEGRHLTAPVVAGIPRGGLQVAAAFAEILHAQLDVVIARKLPAPWHKELAIGAVAEEAQEHLLLGADWSESWRRSYLDQVRKSELAMVQQRVEWFRRTCPQIAVADRSVVVVDDGVATGATLVAALKAMRIRGPRELIAAVPVASEEALQIARHWCDELFCLHQPESFHAVGQFYDAFAPVDDAAALQILERYRRSTVPVLS